MPHELHHRRGAPPLLRRRCRRCRGLRSTRFSKRRAHDDARRAIGRRSRSSQKHSVATSAVGAAVFRRGCRASDTARATGPSRSISACSIRMGSAWCASAAAMTAPSANACLRFSPARRSRRRPARAPRASASPITTRCGSGWRRGSRPAPGSSLPRPSRPELPEFAGESLRYDPHHPFDGERVPAMFALVRDIRSNKPQAIHRTRDVRGAARITTCTGKTAWRSARSPAAV